MTGRNRRRLRGFPVSQLIPNMMTTLALCAGVSAIRFGVVGHWRLAVLLVLLAAVFDALDGRLARLLDGASRFGAELDSLSDFVSFGVAPAVLLYFWGMGGVGTLGWVAVLIFTICAAFRLARFNTMLDAENQPPFAYRYFTGVPAPAGAGLVLIPFMLWFKTGAEWLRNDLLIGAWAVMIGLLMISRIPSFSLKGQRIPHRYILPVLVVAALVAALLVTDPWSALPLVGGLYLAMLPFSYRDYQKRLQEWRATQESPAAPAAAAAEDTA